jgi:hypothetical protein
MNHRIQGSSPVDLSFLLDAPAGKDGFVRIQNGHFVTPKGQRVRLWGVNVTDWSAGSVLLPSREDAPLWAATLARYGVNCVRLHFLDLATPRGIIDAAPNDSRHLDAAQLDRLDFWISELKKRGIYINLNLAVGRSFKSGDGVPDGIGGAKALRLINARLIELQKEYARALLTHVNPYTKLEYRNDPAFIIVEITNEDGILSGSVQLANARPPFDAEITSQFNAWVRKTMSPADQEQLRKLAGVDGQAPIPRLRREELAAAPALRYRADLAFYMDAEAAFYREMKSYLKDTLGVKSLLIASADHSHSGSSYPMLTSHAQMDIIDGHVYWQHPRYTFPGFHIDNTPMVNDPLHSTVVQLSRTAFAGKPYTVTETNHPFPNEWGSEGLPILAAYANLQDWDGIFWYTFEPKLPGSGEAYPHDYFDMSGDPVKMTQLASCALLFLRGDASPARTVVERSYSKEQTIDSMRLPAASEGPYFTPGFPPSIPLKHGSRIRSLEGAPTMRLTDETGGAIVSDTRELSWYASADKTGLVTIETPRSQALVGFVKARRKALQHLSADVSNDFAAIVVTSLDSKPLASASRMLLTTGARVANTGMKWNADRTSLAVLETKGGRGYTGATTDWGKPPVLIEPVAGTVTLRNLKGATGVTVRPLDGSGKPLGKPISATRGKDGWKIPVGEPVTTWYEVEVSR